MFRYLLPSIAFTLACTTTTTDDERNIACGDITGNYHVESKRLSGTCPASPGDNGTSTMSFSRSADGSIVATTPNLEGGCRGTLDPSTCRFTASCSIFDQTGRTAGTVAVDYVFSGGTFSGTTANGIEPPYVTERCSVTYRDEGQRL